MINKKIKYFAILFFQIQLMIVYMPISKLSILVSTLLINLYEICQKNCMIFLKKPVQMIIKPSQDRYRY